MSVCPQCETDAHLRLQRRDGEPGYQCDACGTWMQFGALPPRAPSKGRAAAHKASPGHWPTEVPLTEDGKVEEGLVVLS
jgi:Zn ribbon nucleic-acid-binding protein